MKMMPTPRVAIQPTASFSDSPARDGKSAGKMSLRDDAGVDVQDARDAGHRRAEHRREHDADETVGQEGEGGEGVGRLVGVLEARPHRREVGWSTRMARGGRNQMTAPTRKRPKQRRATFRAEASSSTLK